jgi:hypothetical protein
MDEALKEALKRIAEEENRTMSRQVVHWVREKIAEYGSKKAS